MANRTVKEAKNVHGTNPQYLVEKIIRSRIYDSKYWKEQCFALTAELLVDKAMELRFVGGVYGGNIKPTQFLCLTLKMLQIQPEKDIVVEFIKNEEFKYVRALGAFYLRLTGSAIDCYKYLEPLYNDNRKLRRQNRNGQFEIVYMDDFIDELLKNDRVCDIILPRIQKRSILEENNEIEPKVSALDEDLDDVPSDEEIIEKVEEMFKKPKHKKKERSKSKEREKKHENRKKDFDKERENAEREKQQQRRHQDREQRDREQRDRELREQREREIRDREQQRERKRHERDRDERYNGKEYRDDRHPDNRDRRREKDRERERRRH